MSKEDKQIKDAVTSIKKEIWDGDPVELLSESARKNKPDGLVYPFGIKEFDKAMGGGAREGDLIVVSAGAGQGKTTFARQLTINLSKKSVPTFWLSYEMSSHYLYEKFKAMGAADVLAYTPSYDLAPDTGYISYVTDKAIEKYATKCVVIDHLEYLTGKEAAGRTSYWIDLGFIVRDLKKMAIDKKIFVVLIAQTKKYARDEQINMYHIKGAQTVASESDYIFMLERVREDAINSGGKPSLADFLPKAKSRYTNFTNVYMEKNRHYGELPALTMQLKDEQFVPVDLKYYAE